MPDAGYKPKNPYERDKKSVKDSESHYEKASPTLLSKQAAEVPDGEEHEDMPGWAILRGHLEQRLQALRTWRQSWWYQNWAQLAQYILPRRSIWMTQSTGGWPSPNNMTRGQELNQSIVDPTATFATRVCAGGLMSGLASPSRPWFKILPSIKNFDLDEAGRLWLDSTEDRIYTVLAASNFYNSFAQECEDLVVFGTAPVIIYEDETDLVRFYNPCVGEYFLASSASLRIDGLYRAFVMTVAQIVDFFGLENCPADVQKLWAAKGNSLEVERIVAHSIEPNFGILKTDTGKIPGNFIWREVYWLYAGGAEKPFSMRGFEEVPFTCARWSTQSNDAYGRSPGMDVLPDVLQLQTETRRKAEAIEKQVRPPLIADMKMKNQPASVLPGHVTYVDGLTTGTGMRSIYEVNPDINAMVADLTAIQARIKTGLFNDLFNMLQEVPTGKMTAYEVAARAQEKLQIVGPIIEGLITESLKPKLARVFSIMKSKGLIDPPPPSLQGVPLDIQFVSMLVLAQKAAATGSLERLAAFVGNLSAVYPQAKDNLDPDMSIREMSELLGAPEKVLTGPEKMVQIRQVAAQQAAMAQKAAMQQHVAETAKTGADAANTLSQTTVGAGNDALSMLLGGKQ